MAEQESDSSGQQEHSGTESIQSQSSVAQTIPPSVSPSKSDLTAEQLKYEDPRRDDPARKGMLLSNEIEWFCERRILIEDKYSVARIRPASYTLTIGPEYVDSKGHRQKLKGERDTFYMDPNSIVYVSTAESLNLPYYIAARFNLRVKWVYKGILLGTGPQVEPGFRGKLSCPLFNLTDRPIRIKLGDEFATIDFERTTDFGGGLSWKEMSNKKRSQGDLDVIQVNDERFLLFKQTPFLPLQHLPDHDIVSSLVQLQEEVKRWRTIGVGIVIAFVSLALTLLNFQANLYREQKATSQQVFQLQEDLGIAKEQIKDLQRPPVAAEPSAKTSPPGPKRTVTGAAGSSLKTPPVGLGGAE